MNISRKTYINNINIYKQTLNNIQKNTKNIELKKDKIEISQEAKNISSQICKINNPLREEKIDKIKKSIQDGSYNINYDEIAKKILTKMRG